MKTFLILAVAAVVLFAPMVGAARVEAGGLFDANSGERILEAAVAGVVVGVAVGVLAEAFGVDDRGGRVVVYDQRGSWHARRGGCRGCEFEYRRQYNSGYAAGENARRYERFQWQEESRRRDAIRSERAGNRGRMDGFEDGRRHR